MGGYKKQEQTLNDKSNDKGRKKHAHNNHGGLLIRPPGLVDNVPSD